LNGVNEFVDRGDFKLNQGVYTVMSFNRGLDSDKPNRVDAFTRGNAGTMMALDVAALQQMYGAWS